MPPTRPAPAPPPPEKKTSTLKKIVYVIILLVALSILLQILGVGVVNKRESDTLIEQPHAD
ncbi:hypothetical protein CLV84_0749 [Neolewinella xylanilytica]|uniref:Uncharacterized protein n=1 Tax=Neolewinella xylanilytica TaxID=1514080 RepID=A0A2S6I8G4_9BACT|nr:hypothetical protein [Neolewinella xylanilytica]PPK87796.1 hypothetical protein CLV84_0749 [Neolewinella xylanilytica]